MVFVTRDLPRVADASVPVLTGFALRDEVGEACRAVRHEMLDTPFLKICESGNVAQEGITNSMGVEECREWREDSVRIPCLLEPSLYDRSNRRATVTRQAVSATLVGFLWLIQNHRST